MTNAQTQNIKTATMVISLNESTVELFEQMHFADIPEQAKAIAFFGDGTCVFLDEFSGGPIGGRSIPSFKMLTVFTDVPIQMNE